MNSLNPATQTKAQTAAPYEVCNVYFIEANQPNPKPSNLNPEFGAVCPQATFEPFSNRIA